MQKQFTHHEGKKKQRQCREVDGFVVFGYDQASFFSYLFSFLYLRKKKNDVFNYLPFIRHIAKEAVVIAARFRPTLGNNGSVLWAIRQAELGQKGSLCKLSKRTSGGGWTEPASLYHWEPTSLAPAF